MADPERFRIYRRRGQQLDLIGTCDCPEAVGVAIATLMVEGEFEDCTVGVLDRPEGEEVGEWVLSPFPTA